MKESKNPWHPPRDGPLSEVQRAYEANMAYDWVRLAAGRVLHAEPHLSTGDALGSAALAALRGWRHHGSAG